MEFYIILQYPCLYFFKGLIINHTFSYVYVTFYHAYNKFDRIIKCFKKISLFYYYELSHVSLGNCEIDFQIRYQIVYTCAI